MAKITRAEAEAMVEGLMQEGRSKDPAYAKESGGKFGLSPDSLPHHFGWCEIRTVFDAIYGTTPE